MALLTVSSGGVPSGNYTGTFADVEAQPENKEKGYPAGLRWKWTINAGPCAGQIVSRVTGNSPSPNNACGKVLSGLIGRPLQEGESIDPDQFVGKPYMLVVAAGQGGGTRIDAVVPLPAAKTHNTAARRLPHLAAVLIGDILNAHFTRSERRDTAGKLAAGRGPRLHPARLARRAAAHGR
jgi:hypothetical protein